MCDEPNWPVSLLASAYEAYHEPPSVTMAICVGYFEAQATGTAPTMTTVSGYVSTKVRWRSLEERWPRILRHEGLTAFNGQDFVDAAGEFSAGWRDNQPRRLRLVEALARLIERHTLRAVSCSLRLEDYRAINERYRFAESAGGPYALCAAHVVARVQTWMAQHCPDDLTLFVFEDGDVDHREIRRILKGEGVHRGEPVQLWPRQWTDERGRARHLRPFEACDVLALQLAGHREAGRLEGSRLHREVLEPDHLRRLCHELAVAERSSSGTVTL